MTPLFLTSGLQTGGWLLATVKVPEAVSRVTAAPDDTHTHWTLGWGSASWTQNEAGQVGGPAPWPSCSCAPPHWVPDLEMSPSSRLLAQPTLPGARVPVVGGPTSFRHLRARTAPPGPRGSCPRGVLGPGRGGKGCTADARMAQAHAAARGEGCRTGAPRVPVGPVGCVPRRSHQVPWGRGDTGPQPQPHGDSGDTLAPALPPPPSSALWPRACGTCTRRLQLRSHASRPPSAGRSGVCGALPVGL